MKQLFDYCLVELRQRSFWVSALIAGSLVYLALPILSLLWLASGCVGFIASSALWRRYADHKESALRAALEEPPGFTYVAYTRDGARVGEIPEQVYLRARFRYDIDVMSRFVQALNYAWVGWCVIARVIMTIPVALVLVAFMAPQLADTATLSELTLGQILSSTQFVQAGWTYVGFMAVLYLMATMAMGLNRLPGYRNYRGELFKRLLSDQFPDIATANGFFVSIYKIDPGTGDIEIPSH